MTLTLSSEKAMTNCPNGMVPKDIIAWDNFVAEQDDVEKLVYPMVVGDEYDKGETNEVLSQIHAFQGTLFKFNSCPSGTKDC